MAPTHQKPSNNRFDALDDEQQAQDSQGVQQATVDYTTVRPNQISGAAVAKAGDKRAADTSLGEQPQPKKPRTAAENAQVARNARAALAARKAAKNAAPVSTGEQEVTGLQAQHHTSDTIVAAPTKEAFPYHDLPTHRPVWGFCTFGQLDKTSKTPWLIGELGEQSIHGHALSLKFDTRPSGIPSLTFRLHMEIMPTWLPFKRENEYDYAEYQWTVPQQTSADTRTVENFSYQLFKEWIKDASPEILALPQVVEAMKPENCGKAVVVTCKLHRVPYTDFRFPLCWRNIPLTMAREFRWLASRPVPEFNSFLFITRDCDVKVKTIPEFRRLVNEGL